MGACGRVLAPALLLGLSLALSLGAAACGGSAKPSSSIPDETCQKALGPSPGAPAAPPSPVPSIAPSRVVTHVELRLASVQKELEARIPRRLAEERGRDIGVAGSLDLEVDRGPLAVLVEGESLVVRTDLRAQARACAKGRCYASCDPGGVATARVPLRLTPAYGFSPPKVDVVFTRPCKIKVLGGFLRVDVTDTVRAELGPSLRRVEQEIAARLPQPRPQAERLWRELASPRSLPLGACAVLRPRGIVQGPVRGTNDALRARFAVIAEPEVRMQCGDTTGSGSTAALPPLAYDPRLPEEDVVVLATTSPIERAIASLSPSSPFELEGARVRVTRATANAAGGELDLALAIRGEACGDLNARSSLAWSDDASGLRFTRPELAAVPAIPATLTPERVRALAPELVASAAADPSAEVRVHVREATPDSAFARGRDVVASMRLRGSVEVVAK